MSRSPDELARLLHKRIGARDHEGTAALAELQAQAERCCGPDMYVCHGEVECPHHGGFDVCCDEPETHVSLVELQAQAEAGQRAQATLGVVLSFARRGDVEAAERHIAEHGLVDADFVPLAAAVPSPADQECGAPNATRACEIEPCWCRREPSA